MRSILLQSGLAMLNAQQEYLNRLHILGFDMGARACTQAEMNLWDSAEIPIGGMQGQIVVSADYTYMSYVKVSDDTVKLTGYVPESAPEVDIGNVTIYAGFGEDSRAPFSFSATDADTIKIQTQGNSPGYAYWFNLLLRLPDLDGRFDFSNLNIRIPEWPQVGSEQNLPYPYQDGHDQFIVSSHSEYGGLHPIIGAQNRHLGCPMAELLDLANPNKTWVVGGGQSGDGYFRTR